MDSQKISEVWPEWRVVRNIGNGRFGSVYEVERNQFGKVEKAAVKVLTVPDNRSIIDEMRSDGYDDASIAGYIDDDFKNVVDEYYLMRELSGHSNIVDCYDMKYVKHADGLGYDVFIRMELLTSLNEAVRNGLDVQTAEKTALKLGKDICHALELCEKKNIVHRDIKPQNILLSESGDYKLGDFGIARIIEHTTNATKTGTHGYMAPEVEQRYQYGNKADIFSLGMVLYWLLNERRLPFQPLPPTMLKPAIVEEAWKKQVRGVSIPAPRNGSDALKLLVLKACAYKAQDRFTSAGEMLRALELAESGGYAETRGTAGDGTQEKASSADSFRASGGLSGTDNVAGTVGNSTSTVGGTASTIGAGWETAETIGKQTKGKSGGDRTTEFEKTVGIKSEPKASAPKTAAPTSDTKQESVRNKTADTKSDISLKNYPACKCLRILTYLLIAFFAYGEWQWFQNFSELSTPIGKNLGILGTIICGLFMVSSYDGDLSPNIVQDSVFFYIIALLLPLNTTAFSTIVKLWSDWQQSKEGWTPVLSWSSPSSVWWVVYVIFLLLIILIAALSMNLQKRKVELLRQSSLKSEESLLVETESILLQYLTYVGLLTFFYGLFAIGSLLGLIDLGIYVVVIIGSIIIFSGITDLWIGKLSVSAFLMWIIPTFLMGAASIDTFMKWYRYLYSDVGNIEYALYFGLGVYFVVTAVLAFRIRDRRKQLGF